MYKIVKMSLYNVAKVSQIWFVSVGAQWVKTEENSELILPATETHHDTLSVWISISFNFFLEICGLFIASTFVVLQDGNFDGILNTLPRVILHLSNGFLTYFNEHYFILVKWWALFVFVFTCLFRWSLLSNEDLENWL